MSSVDTPDNDRPHDEARLRRRRAIWGLAQVTLAIALVATVIFLLGYGVQLRQRLFAATDTIRFRGDIGNAFGQGSRVVQDAQRNAGTEEIGWWDFLRGWHGRYDEVARVRDTGERASTDYVPARLLIMSIWSWHLHSQDPPVRQWRDPHLQPLLRFNAIMQFISAAGMFMLVWIWVRRGQRDKPPDALAQNSFRSELRQVLRRWKPWLLGLAAAMLLWFNLAVMWNAHAWPQWDTWVLPFYIWAAVLASVGWWFGAGAIVALGCMFKGQILLGAPVLVLWPLFAGNPGGALRVLLGFALGLTSITSIWLINGWEAWTWVIGVALLATAVWVVHRGRWYRWALPVAAWMLIGWMIWPLVRGDFVKYLPLAVLAGMILAAPPAILRQRGLGYIVVALVAGSIALACVRFEGSLNWYRFGLEQGTHQYEYTTHKGPVNNLASIMGMVYSWRLQHPVEFSVAGLEVQVQSLQRFLRYLYAAGIVLCALGLAVQSRRNSPRALLALAAPWVVLFAVLGQMHERYFIWAAALTAAGVAVGLGPTLLHLLITGLATAMMAQSMLNFDRGYAPAWHTTLVGMHPHIGWVVLLLGGIYLYMALAPGRRGRPPDPGPRLLIERTRPQVKLARPLRTMALSEDGDRQQTQSGRPPQRSQVTVFLDAK